MHHVGVRILTLLIIVHGQDPASWGPAHTAVLAPVRLLVGLAAVGSGQAAPAHVPVAPMLAVLALAQEIVYESLQPLHHLAMTGYSLTYFLKSSRG
jgi:hypothetical protein